MAGRQETRYLQGILNQAKLNCAKRVGLLRPPTGPKPLDKKRMRGRAFCLWPGFGKIVRQALSGFWGPVTTSADKSTRTHTHQQNGKKYKLVHDTHPSGKSMGRGGNDIMMMTRSGWRHADDDRVMTTW